jgi:hypothetical protein
MLLIALEAVGVLRLGKGVADLVHIPERFE